MKNKQKLYFVLNLLVLLPLFIVMLLNLLTAILDYLMIQNLWLNPLTDISTWYIDIILAIITKNASYGGELSFIIIIIQAVLSLILIVSGYFSGLLRGATFKVMLGIFVGGLILVFISIPIQLRLDNRRRSVEPDEALIEQFNKFGETVYIYPNKTDECLNKYLTTTDHGINNPRPIGLKSGQFTPKNNANITTLNCFSGIEEYYFGLVQFSDISKVSSKEGKAELADMGIELVGYINENAFFAKFNKTKITYRKNDILATNIRWFGSFKPEYKDSKLKERNITSPTVKLQALFFEGISVEDKNKTLEILKSEYKAVILYSNFNESSFNDYVSVEIPVEEMWNIAKLSTIQYVSFPPPPPTTD